MYAAAMRGICLVKQDANLSFVSILRQQQRLFINILDGQLVWWGWCCPLRSANNQTSTERSRYKSYNNETIILIYFSKQLKTIDALEGKNTDNNLMS